MANHLHKQIRDALVTTLTGLATTGSRVYANRLMPMADANVPGLRISLDSEESNALTMHQPHTQDRTLNLMVECCAKSAIGLDDALDQISKEVEIALSAGITISGRNLPVFYAGMTFSDELIDRPVGIKALRYSIPFTAMNNAPDALS